MPEDRVPFADLDTADLVLDRVYEGGKLGHVGDDAIGKLLPVGGVPALQASTRAGCSHGLTSPRSGTTCT